MGCGSSRSPVRVGILHEDDVFNSQEPFRPLVDSWVEENEVSTYMQPPSPPPYTPVPIEGHVTLMHSSHSPAKRQNSLETSFHASELEAAAAEPACSFRSTGGASTHSYGVGQETGDVLEPSPDLNSSHTSAEVMELLFHSPPRRNSCAGDESVSRGQGNMQSNGHPTAPNYLSVSLDEHRLGTPENRDFTNLPGTASNQLSHQESSPFPSLSSSQTEPSESSPFPPARPPSPFPQNRPFSHTSPPPLALLRPLGSHRVMPTDQDLSGYERMPFRLPPLQQLQQLQPQQERENTHRKHRRKKRHTWHGQPVTGLGSISEQVTIVE